MTPEGDCSETFKISLLDDEAFKEGKQGGFLYKCITSLTNTRKGLPLDDEKVDSQSLGKFSANVAGTVTDNVNLGTLLPCVMP